MTNEELTAEIQRGNTDLMGQLWEQTRRFICVMARRYYTALGNRGGTELEDLHSCGYLALHAAAGSYSPDEGMTFIGWLAKHLQTAFLSCYGLRAHKNDPLHYAASLDAPIDQEDADGAALVDLVGDPAGAAAFEAAEDEIYYSQLHEALERALCALPAEQAEPLRLKYYNGLTWGDVGTETGQTTGAAIARAKEGLRGIRRSPAGMALRRFIDFDYYVGTGLGSFNRTGCSVEERYLIRLEEAEI